ncbi:MAG: Helix-hairpin-helix motif protein [Methanosaeta sp. PtaU1.Bin060]|nr:MAG: Helix-hairpin-helix motif protein [Methanosaeta sp. PtaU1.Bin060]
MVSLEKIAHLAEECRFDSLGPMMGQTIEVDSEKLAALGAGTRHDVCASTYSPRSPAMPGICHAFSHDGRCVSLFKTLYTNSCTHQCSYCTNAVGCTHRKRTFSYTPEELARITLALYRSNYIEGLFLSSGSGGDEDRIMECIVETAWLLRKNYCFQGYIHLKVLPGSSQSRIEEAVELADRVSINLEAASTSRMGEICPTKDYESDILQRQRYIRDLITETKLPAGQTTQLVVGAAGESDLEIFRRVLYEYKEIGVRRAYYSAFSPQRGTPFEAKSPQPLWREHRLYQMDWLYRIYHFHPDEIRCAFDEDGFLPDADPKMAVAMQTLVLPVDPNSASYSELLRVPGIGPASARRIMGIRQRRRITKREDLARLGVRVRRASPFLKINGWINSTLEMWSA